MNTPTETSAPPAGTPATDARGASAPESAGCCGGPAPEPASACCVRDAEAKSAGAPGCGCAPKHAQAAKSCC